jgi:heme-degrading monooxygenase HmoA
MVKQKVEDYGRWKSVFDNASEMRKNGGERGVRLFHYGEDTGQVMVLAEWDTLERARSYVNSPEVAEAMRKAGVTEKPEIYFLDEIPADG